MPSSFKTDNNVFQSEVAAEVFNDYFINVAKDLQSQTDNKTSPINLLKSAYQTVFQHMETVPVTKG